MGVKGLILKCFNHLLCALAGVLIALVIVAFIVILGKLSHVGVAHEEHFTLQIAVFPCHKLCNLLLVVAFAIHEAAELSYKYVVVVLAIVGATFALEAVKNTLHEIFTLFTCNLVVALNEVNDFSVAKLVALQLSALDFELEILHISSKLKFDLILCVSGTFDGAKLAGISLPTKFLKVI